MTAADITGSGYAEIFARAHNSKPLVLWGGAEGISLERCAALGAGEESGFALEGTTAGRISFETTWKPKILRIDGRTYLFGAEKNRVRLFPVAGDGTINEPLTLNCGNAVSAASGDINADGVDDLVLAVSAGRGEKTI